MTATDTLELTIAMRRAFKPPERLKPSEWIEREVHLPRATNARPGRVRLTAAQKGMVDAAAEPDTRELIYMTSTQIGKSLAIMGLLGWSITTEGGPHLAVRPDESDAAAWVRETLNPLIKATPALRDTVGRGASHSDSSELKDFPTGSLAITGSWKASALAGKSNRVAVIDELDRCAMVVQSAGTGNSEGEPSQLVRRRLSSYRRRSLLVLASTPTSVGLSRIAARHEAGDQRKFFVTCRECDDVAPITPERLAHKLGDDPSNARLACLACGNLADEAERMVMLRGGEWRATAKGEPGVVSFHLNELGSEFSTIKAVAEAVNRATDLESRRVLTNTTWGLPFAATAEIEATVEDLRARATLDAKRLPADVDRITVGADVQKSRIEVAVLAHGKSGERYVLAHVTLPGDTSTDAPWGDLSSILGRTFPTVDGRSLPIAATAVDAGFGASHVVGFVLRERGKRRRVYPVIGRPGWHRLATAEGSRIKGTIRATVVGVDNVKLSFLQGLTRPTRGAGYTHLAVTLSDDSLAQLTSERLEVKATRGRLKETWVPSAVLRNDFLDAAIYALAIDDVARQSKRVSDETTKQTSVADLAVMLNNASNHQHRRVH